MSAEITPTEAVAESREIGSLRTATQCARVRERLPCLRIGQEYVDSVVVHEMYFAPLRVCATSQQLRELHRPRFMS